MIHPPRQDESQISAQGNPNDSGFGSDALKAKYQQLREAGKSAKAALVALMRKLIEIANALIKADRLWAEKPACA